MKTPIAVIGIGCRYPGGVNSPETFWNLVCNGVDAIREIPPERWDSRLYFSPSTNSPGKAYVRRGGFLQDSLFDFDALFFGISPREADVLDPQQRLLLEVTYEAMEDAGLQIERLKNSRTGVFIGGFTLDNMLEQLNQSNLRLNDSFTPASLTMTMLSNRLSYSFGLQGPSMTVDTACSSSLVATHLGCQSLWTGESDLAIVGGVNVLLRPEFFITLSKGQFLSTHGYCKAYAQDASGYVRSEGAGVVILKPLPKALENGDHIWAVIHNTGVNQDGTTAGISSPNQFAQEALLRQLLQTSDIAPADIHYMEAHGTGTQAGDKAEAAALHRVLSEGRPAQEKCFVGSVKTNIGHSESAAGVAGLIKAIQVINRKRIPPNLHFDTPNPEIPFDNMCIRIPTKMEKWPKPNARHLACVSSFGYGGTNAAAVIEAPPQPTKKQTAGQHSGEQNPLAVIPVSARSRSALTAMTKQYGDYLEKNPELSWSDLKHTLCFRRSHFKYRTTFLAADPASLQSSLQQFSQDVMPAWASIGDTTAEAVLPLTFVYTGMGPQHAGMGMTLFREERVFRETMLRCEEIYSSLFGVSILEEIAKQEDVSNMADTRISQPANFFIQAALTDLFASWGIVPDQVVGHSVGEVASAYASGALSLEDALRVSYHRGRLQQTLAGTGTLLAVELTEEEALKLLKKFPEVSIAAINGATSLTLAGATDQLQAIQTRLKKLGRFNQVMKVSIPFHSPQMNAIEQELKTSLADLKPRIATIPVYSTVTGKQLQGSEFNGHYWWLNVRETVRFAEAIHNILDDCGDGNFLEIGPHPVLRSALLQCLAETKSTGRSVQSMNRKTEETPTVRKSLGELFCLGYTPDWEKLGAASGQYIKLPPYPWQRETHAIRRTRAAQEQLQIGDAHPLLAWRSDTSAPCWQTEVSGELNAFIQDHRVSGEVVVPGAAYVEAGLAAHQAHFGGAPCLLENLTFHNMLVLDEKTITRMSVSINPKTGHYEVHSRAAEDQPHWTLHATGSITDGEAKQHPVDLSAFLTSCTEEQNIADFYKTLSGMGLDYGPAFRTVTRLHRSGNGQAVLARIERQTAPEEAYLLHPTLIDGAFQALVALSQGKKEETTAPMVPVAIERFSFNRPARTVVYVYAELTQADDSQLKANLNFFEEDGESIAYMQGVKCQRISSGDQAQEDLGRYFYDHTWEEKALEDLSPRQGVEREQWLILADQNSAEPLSQKFARRGIPHLVAVSGEKTRLKGKQLILNPNDRDGMLDLVKLKAKSGLSHILHLWNLHPAATRDVQGELVQSTMQLRNLIEALRNQLGEQKLNVISVTSAAHVVTPDDRGQNLTAAPLSAFGRLIENEYANIRFQHFDFEDVADFRNHALQLLLADSNEREVALRSKTLWLRRLKRAPQLGMAERHPRQRFHSSEHCLELQMPLPDDEESVYFRQRDRNKPKAEEVEIQLHCASLQPTQLQAPQTPGDTSPIFSFSGTVSQTGSGVGHLQIGDTVMGIGTGTLRSFFLTPAQNLILKPQGVSILEAAGLAELLEAYYALTQIARLKKGEKIWIGNAAGSTGLAAIEIAKWIGAEIFASVPDAEIFQYLKMRGVEKIYTSNGPALEDDLIADTQGQGMDVVLHIGPEKPLAGRFGAVAPCGRIIELGHRQGQADVFLPQVALQKNLTFAVADFQRMLVEKPHLCGQLLAAVARHLATGSFRPASVKAISADQIGDLLTIPQAPMGGLAVTFTDTEIQAETEAETPLFRTDGTYLVTGGSKGFGLEVARWIAQQGGGTLVLASRSGADESSQQALSEMAAAGVQVLIRQTDIGDEDAIRNLISDIGNTLPPLRGIFHAAVVLEDALLSDLTAGNLARTLHAKVGGLLHLDKHTRDCPLDFFMTFSSVSALIGNTGQTAYVVGNAFLDAFAQYRHSRGLPATSIDFGAIADVGILKKRAQVEDFFRRHGILSMKPALTCRLLGRALRAGLPVVGIFDVDWPTLAPAMPIIQASPVFSELASAAGGNGAQGNGQLEALHKQLTELEPEAQEGWLNEQIAKEVSRILGLAMEKIDLNERFANMGIDSLSAVELGVGLREALGAEFSTVNLLNLASVNRLSTEIFDQLRTNAKVN